MTYTVIASEQFEEEYDLAASYACSIWGDKMQVKHDARLEQVWSILESFPETFPRADYPDTDVRKVPFYGPMVLYYSIERASETVWLVSLWDGRREGLPKL